MTNTENRPVRPPKNDGESVTFTSQAHGKPVTVTRIEGQNLRVTYPETPSDSSLLYEVAPGVFNLQAVPNGDIVPPIWRELDWEILLERL
jgi:hypothetical protein